jgi:hypothetical protein
LRLFRRFAMKIDHAIVTFIAVITILLACAAVPSFEQKSAGIDCGKLWQAAHERAVREGK